MILSELPPELILEIYKWLFDTLTVNELQIDVHRRRDWSIKVLTVCMICKSWYSVGTYYISKKLSSLPYDPLNYLLQTVETISYPTNTNKESIQQPTWVNLLMASQQNHLDLHRHVRKIILNLSLLFNQVPLTTTRKKAPPKKGRNTLLAGSLLKNITTLFEICPNINKIEIVYDSRYTPRLTDYNHQHDDDDDESISFFNEIAKIITTMLTKHAKIHNSNRKLSSSSSSSFTTNHCTYLNHLILKSNESTQRCFCCIGKGWDHFLSPILKALPITIIELNRVLPSQTVLEHLAYQNTSSPINTLIIRGNVLTQASRLARYGTTMSLPPRIPIELFNHIQILDIYLQNDDHHANDYEYELDLLLLFKQIDDLIYPMKSLKKIMIHGYPSSSLSIDNPYLGADVWLKLKHLSERCQLDSLILENLPGFQCKDVQSKLHDLFFGIEDLSIIYTN